MGIAERKQSEKYAFRKKILNAAGEIIIKEGYENLSIRKIAALIEYSPTVIYNYFQDKSEIVECLIDSGSDQILEALRQTQQNGNDEIEALHTGLASYIDIMLKNSQLFKALIMNNIGASDSKPGMLHKGVSEEKKTLAFVKQLIQSGIEKGIFRNGDSELLTQVVWSSTFGLLSRLVLENHADEIQRQKLIEYHIDFVINALLKKQTGEYHNEQP